MSARAYNFAYLDEQTKRMIRRAILKAVAIPGYQVPFASREMPMPYGWGTGGVQVTASIIGPDDVLKVIDQGADDTTNAVSIRAFFAKTAGVATTTDTAAGDHHPDPPPHSRDAADRRPDPRLPGADPRAAALPRAARDRDAHHARARRIRRHARQALRGHRAPRPHRHDLRLSRVRRRPLHHGPLADPQVRQSEDGRLPGAATVRRRPREAHLRDPALYARRLARFRGPSLRAHQVRRGLRILRLRAIRSSTRSSSTTRAGACSSAPTPTIAKSARRARSRSRRAELAEAANDRPAAFRARP